VLDHVIQSTNSCGTAFSQAAGNSLTLEYSSLTRSKTFLFIVPVTEHYKLFMVSSIGPGV